MTLIYSQSNGTLSYAPAGENPRILGRGYSGHPPYVNDPEAEALKARGPIPRGCYRVSSPWDHVRLGPVVFFLEPVDAKVMFGRSGFLIHGDNKYGNRSASHGCIILPRKVRDELATIRATSRKALVLEVVE